MNNTCTKNNYNEYETTTKHILETSPTTQSKTTTRTTSRIGTEIMNKSSNISKITHV